MLHVPRTLGCIALSATIWVTAGCGSTPTLTPVGSGPYVGVDRTSGGTRGGLVQAPSAGIGWPPAASPSQPGQCTNEQAVLEHELGVTPVACPAVESTRDAQAEANADKPIVNGTLAEGDADAPIAGGAAADRDRGIIPTCYPLESRILVVDYQYTSSLCKHIVGLGLFKAHQP